MKQLTHEHRAPGSHSLRANSQQLGLLLNFWHHPESEREPIINQLFSCIAWFQKTE